jgi:hypothetical protein
MAEYRQGISEASLIRPSPVLVLSSTAAPASVKSGIDLSLSFDEGNPSLFRDSSGHYSLTVPPTIEAVDRRFARAGYGAVLFPGASPPGENSRPAAYSPDAENGATKPKSGGLFLEPRNGALFAPNTRIMDFSLEFWLNPLSLENGEQILMWVSSRPMRGAAGSVTYGFQRILCVSSRNRLQWSFLNFFTSPDGTSGGGRNIDINFSGTAPVVPKTWSHHVIRFDSQTGLIEYLVNGKSESVEYATSTGHEGGEVYLPLVGEGGSFTLGGNFMGLMDEFRIHGSYLSGAETRKFPRSGRIETGAIDLGAGNNGVIAVEASGGRTLISDPKISGQANGGEYKRNGRLRFSDDSELQIFIRTSDNPYRWNTPWLPVTPGENIGGVSGRYVQLAADFYSSSSGNASPYLEEIRIIYHPDEPPLPPAQLTAVALDGAVQLRWRNSPDLNTQGYLVYYGNSADDYFGEGAVLGSSPIDVGKQNSIRIDGLKNGVLYYFHVAAYSRRTPGDFGNLYHSGEFSREARARPLQGLGE